MLNQVFLFTASGVLIFWGIAHLFPTCSVVKGFGDITDDNKKIICMEWINEGVTLIFIGATILIISLFDHAARISIFLLWADFFALNILSVISLFTGFRIHSIPFRLCPVIFSMSSILILMGIYL